MLGTAYLLRIAVFTVDAPVFHVKQGRQRPACIVGAPAVIGAPRQGECRPRTAMTIYHSVGQPATVGISSERSASKGGASSSQRARATDSRRRLP